MHEASCNIRGAYKERSLSKSTYKPLRRDATKAVDYVVSWSQKHGVSPCDFLFFAKKHLDDLGHFSYGDLNLNVQGCRATLHDTLAKLFEEKYQEIEADMIKNNVYESIYSDLDRKFKIYAKVCLDDTTAAVKSAKGASRLPISSWLRDTVGIVGVEITWHSHEAEVEAADVREDETEEKVVLQSITSVDIGTVVQILKDLPNNIKNCD